MTSRMRSATTSLAAALAATLLIGMSTGASAAVEATAAGTPAAQKPIEELEQLAEIRVRGKYLARVIEDTEDDFFKLYNKLNKKGQFDIYCGRMSVDGSLITRRKCVPSFLVDSLAPPWIGPVGGGSCIGQSSGASYPYFDGFANQMVYGGTSCFSSRSINISSPMAVAVSSYKRTEYLTNVVNVVKSDPRLLAKVHDLDGLYKEMDLVQGRYRTVRATKAADTGPATPHTSLRPR